MEKTKKDMILLRVFKHWNHDSSFVSKARLLAEFFQEGRHRAGKRIGLCLHDTKIRG